ncbi:BACON domain-containing carbohydrate-binding protein [Chitinophaga sp. CC14]|uniref:BACON domain-containing protein n=1 Tax=Chitinophaga sp. CC14 TaxID=3029199 RepID=UPI003B791F01
MFYTHWRQLPILIIYALIVMVGFSSCGKPLPDLPDQMLSTSIDTVYASPFAGVDSVMLISSDSWSISGSPDWLTITPAAGTGDAWIVLRYSQNTGSHEKRTANLIVQSGERTRTITLIQNISMLPAKAILFAGGGYPKDRDDYDSRDGIGNDAVFRWVSNPWFDTKGNLIVTDKNKIRSITPEGVVTTLPGRFPHPYWPKGVNDSWDNPHGAIKDNQGNMYVLEADENVIYKYAADGTISILAGSKREWAFADGKGTAAKFMGLTCMIMDSEGNLIVADNPSMIRKVTPTGVVTTLAGKTFSELGDGPADVALFSIIYSLAIDKAGNIFVADWGNSAIRKLTPQGVVSTLVRGRGIMDGPLLHANVEEAQSMAVDKDGNLFSFDFYHNIRMITSKGFVYTIDPGIKWQWCFNGLVVGPDNILYIADSYRNIIYKIIIDKLPD